MSTHEHIYIIGKRLAATAALVGLFAKSALAGNVVCAAQPVLDSGNTAWMIVATALVLLMSIPGIALFYGGLVRQKNVLSIIMQTMLIVGVISILWVAIGYTWAFGTGFKESGSPLFFVVGGLDKAFLNGITTSTIMPTGIPELVFVMFQCMFALITPALILGAFAERIKFKGYMIFIILWTILAYFPMAHWVWGGGFLQEMGAIDFAGGTVVHINAGISALVMALMIGKREDYRVGHPILPHNVAFVFLGTSFLWLGWFGFNAGSGLAADGIAALAILNTVVSSSAGLASWMIVERIATGKPTLVGACTGLVAGLVVVTPSAGFVEPWAAVVMGLVVSPACYLAISHLKGRFGYDDALDAFGCHGIGGILGGILTGIFCVPELSWTDHGGLLYTGDPALLIDQVLGIVVTLAIVIVLDIAIAFAVRALMGGKIRVDEDAEALGLDVSEHGESAYPAFSGLD